MKIALVHPSYGENRQPFFPVGLAYITTPLLEAGHEVVPILMDIDKNLTVENVAFKISDEGFDVFGIGALVTRYKFIKELTCAVREKNPSIPIIIGGKIADSIPEKLELNTPVDVLCFGEGERLVVELMDALSGKRSLNSVAGISYRHENSFIKTDKRDPIEDLSTISFPAYDHFPVEKYIREMPYSLTEKLVPGAKYPVAIKSSRGCPFVCTFCRRSFEPKTVRMRAVSNIIDELRLLKSKYGYDSAIFNDELTLISKERALELASAMRKSNLKMKWHCLSRIDFIDREILRELKSAGCTSLGFGIESGSQIILDEMNKKVTVENAKRVLRLCDEEGMLVSCTYIIGMPSETEETVKATVEFIKETGAFGKIFYATAYPGTALWDQAIQTHKITDEETYLDSLNDAFDFVANFTRLTDEKIQALCTEANNELQSYFLKKQIRSDPLKWLKLISNKIHQSIKQIGLFRTLKLLVNNVIRII